MVTRLYLPSTGAADVNPAFDAAWNNTGAADRLKCVTTRISSAMTNKNIVADSTSGVRYHLARQYVSIPINTQTISGTVKGQIRCLESSIAFNGYTAIKIYVVNNAGDTVRGTLLALSAPDAIGTPPEFSAITLTNRQFQDSSENPLLTLTNVDALSGDRIVIEIGLSENTILTSFNGDLNFGDDSATDLAEDQTTTTANNPWLEFSLTISFGSGTSYNESISLTSSSTLTDSNIMTMVANYSLTSSSSIGENNINNILSNLSLASSGTLTEIGGLNLLNSLSLTSSGVLTNVVNKYLNSGLSLTSSGTLTNAVNKYLNSGLILSGISLIDLQQFLTIVGGYTTHEDYLDTVYHMDDHWNFPL